ncbi:hypothetical protein [Bacillus sp. T33-2]|nr:hypothetical protein [Bacillus sp. T33-2]
MGKQKLGNANAQRNNNAKKGTPTSDQLVEFRTVQKNQKQENPAD